MTIFTKNTLSNMYILYGIPNCDTVKKTLAWLQKNQTPYTFHDYKKAGIAPDRLQRWSRQVGWNSILNKKSATWRALGTLVQDSVNDEQTAIALMTKNTSIIKRPVIEKNDTVVTVGFDETTYKKIFTK